jgi:IS5 family transposase
MVRREEQQISLADALVYERVPGNKVLAQIEAHVDWDPLRRRLEKLYRLDGPGRPAFPVITLFKVLLLQNLYHLSDPAAEEAISDRLSFRRFLGLNLDQPVPDHSTIHRFRDRIAGQIDELLGLVTQQLEAQNLILKKGTLVDATLVQSSARRPPLENDGRSSDGGASWTKKNGHSYYGYRAHVGVDQGSELIRQADLTTAHVNDAKRFEQMVSGDEKAVYADKAYYGYQRSAWLHQQKIDDGIKRQLTVDRNLDREAVIAFNQRVEKVRRSVEHVFGTLKRHYHFARCRYRTLARNRCQFLLLCICYNLKRQNRLLSRA